MKVGIWCAYHITLEQSEGIGVFAHHLARGLANLPDPVQVTMMAKTGDHHLMEETIAAGNGRIEVASVPQLTRLEKIYGRLIRLFTRTPEKIAKKATLRLELANKAIIGSAYLSTCNRFGISDRFASSKSGMLLSTLLLPIFVAGMVRSRAYRAGCQLTARVCSAIATRSHQFVERIGFRGLTETNKIIDSCDVWVIPYVGLYQTFSKPTVVTIHDLVGYHFPDVTSAAALQVFKSLAEEVSRRSTVSACMSNFIRDNDLLGILQLPERKVRVVAPAAPTDFGVHSDLPDASKTFPVLNGKYILYPSAFRSYKNHELLVNALHELRNSGDEDMHLVFTGIHAPPESLLALIARYELQDRVHILGKVARNTLALFYQRAFAVMVASRYEQGSFPLMEALYWKCPIACSRIPALLELFEPLGSDMYYFDTDNVSEVVTLIRNFLANRDEILRAQQSKREKIFGRSWVDAAADWREVLEYAIELHASSNSEQARSIGQKAA